MVDDEPKLTVKISYDLADELIVPLLQNQLESLLENRGSNLIPDIDGITEAMLTVLEYNMIPGEYDQYRDRVLGLEE